MSHSLSDHGSPMAGVSQSSPLSHMLFILFINSVVYYQARPVQQTALQMTPVQSHLARPFITAQQNIQSDVTALAARDHKLIIHPDNTVYMLFDRPCHHPPDLNVFFNSHAIGQVHQDKHLGVILSFALSW